MLNLEIMCSVCNKRCDNMKDCMKCEGNVCLRHQYRCEDRSCKSYLICSNCQHQARHSLWRTIEPKTMWVCQACALKADYSYDFFCELCERHHRRLYTCQNWERRVCSRDNFWCAQKSCSHHLCRDCIVDLKRARLTKRVEIHMEVRS